MGVEMFVINMFVKMHVRPCMRSTGSPDAFLLALAAVHATAREWGATMGPCGARRAVVGGGSSCLGPFGGGQ